MVKRNADGHGLSFTVGEKERRALCAVATILANASRVPSDPIDGSGGFTGGLALVLCNPTISALAWCNRRHAFTAINSLAVDFASLAHPLMTHLKYRVDKRSEIHPLVDIGLDFAELGR